MILVGSEEKINSVEFWQQDEGQGYCVNNICQISSSILDSVQHHRTGINITIDPFTLGLVAHCRANENDARLDRDILC
jgi:hypothetical protein